MSFGCCCRLDSSKSSELPADFEWPLIDGETIDPRFKQFLLHMTDRQKKTWDKVGYVQVSLVCVWLSSIAAFTDFKGPNMLTADCECRNASKMQQLKDK